MIGLIDEGQEIHLGEESGINLWTEAIANSKQNWKIHCPEKLAEFFQTFDTTIVEEFNLTTALRTHQALTLQDWVEALLENEIDNARKLSLGLFEENYPIYVTRDLPDAKRYVQEKYVGELAKTYGLMASSKFIVLPKFGIKNDFNSTRFKPEYYIDSNSPYYCCKLNQIVTEFG